MKRERGFTMVEVLVALTIMTIGMLGIVAMQKTSFSASGYTRHATEAAILAEDKLEQLRTVTLVGATDDSELVDSTGAVVADGIFTRAWTFDTSGTLVTITVTVSWSETDGTHSLTFRTLRNLD